MNYYPVLLAGLILLAGCTTPVEPAETEEPEGAGQTAPCPGHFHVRLLVADGDQVVPFYDDGDRSMGAPGVHLHGDDGLLHVHPATVSCVTLGEALSEVGVDATELGLLVNGETYPGEVRLDVRHWAGDWATFNLSLMDETVPNAALVLLMVNPPEDVSDLRAQVAEIPEHYQPS